MGHVPRWWAGQETCYSDPAAMEMAPCPHPSEACGGTQAQAAHA